MTTDATIVGERPLRHEPRAEPDGQFILDLDGFEGPIDLLLSLARDQKVDLARIRIVPLADQYLAFVTRARDLRMELAADYLVMAAWLAYLKSRILLPEPPSEPGPSADDLARDLAFQLERLAAMQAAGTRLMACPRLGVDRFARGRPEALEGEPLVSWHDTLHDLLQAYGAQHARAEPPTLTIAATGLYAVEDIIDRLRARLGAGDAWLSLSALFEGLLAEGSPAARRDSTLVRSLVAASFAASLELAKEGFADLSQSGAFEPLYLRARRAEA